MIIKLIHHKLCFQKRGICKNDRQTKRMYFLIQDDDLLEKYNTVRD